MSQKNDKHHDRAIALAAMIAACQSTTALESWDSFCQELQVPAELMPALVTGRPELLAALKPRALTEAECAAMFAVLKEMIRTNAALRLHAQQTAQLVDAWAGEFRALASLGLRIDDFANFRHSDNDGETG